MPSVLGKAMLVYTGATPVVIDCQGGATLNMETSTTSAVCKDSGAWAEQAPGQLSWSIEVSDSIYDPSATNGIQQLTTAFTNSTLLDVVLGTGVTGSKRYKGKAYITSLQVSAPIDGVCTYNVTFSGSGSLTYENTP